MSSDDRFILKQMSSMEVESFEKFGPEYFQYLMGTDKQQVRDVSKWVMVCQGVHIRLRRGGGIMPLLLWTVQTHNKLFVL